MRISAHLKGRGIGVIFFSLFGGVWMLMALDAQSLTWLLACDLLPTSLLLLRGIGLIAAGRRLRDTEPPPTPEEAELGRKMGRDFGLIFGAEGVAIFIAVNILANLHQGGWIIPTIAIIVGLHFLPLARLFKMPLYFATGVLAIALPLGTALALRAHLDAVDPLVGLEMALILWITVLAVLLRSRRLTAA